MVGRVDGIVERALHVKRSWDVNTRTGEVGYKLKVCTFVVPLGVVKRANSKLVNFFEALLSL